MVSNSFSFAQDQSVKPHSDWVETPGASDTASNDSYNMHPDRKCFKLDASKTIINTDDFKN